MSEHIKVTEESLNASKLALMAQLNEEKKSQAEPHLARTRIEEDQAAMEDCIQQLYKQTNELRQCLGLQSS